MTQPKYAPISEQHEVREFAFLAPPLPWTPHRPGEAAAVPVGARPIGRGVPGPDQGYALKLAEAFAHRLVLEPGEHEDDVLAGAVAIALCRGALCGRAPVALDIAVALELFGFLAPTGDTDQGREITTARRAAFSGAAHDYWKQRALADQVPEASLRLSAAEIASRTASDSEGWRGMVGL